MPVDVLWQPLIIQHKHPQYEKIITCKDNHYTSCNLYSFQFCVNESCNKMVQEITDMQKIKASWMK